MSDSAAVRSRRYRAHRIGDHSLCRPGCSKLLAIAPEPAGDLDVRESMLELARRLEAAHVADPGNAMVARELRATLLAIPEKAAVDPLAELREFSARVS
jgi:hypothetical protein